MTNDPTPVTPAAFPFPVAEGIAPREREPAPYQGVPGPGFVN